MRVMGYVVVAEDEAAIRVHIVKRIHQTFDPVLEIDIFPEMESRAIGKEKLPANISCIVSPFSRLEDGMYDDAAGGNRFLQVGPIGVTQQFEFPEVWLIFLASAPTSGTRQTTHQNRQNVGFHSGQISPEILEW